DGWTATFDRTDYTGVMVDPAYPLAAWPDMAFIDGAARRQVASRAEVVPGTFFVDYAGSKLYIGDNPAGRTVEASARGEALYVNNSPNSVVRGIGFRHYATPVARMGAVKGYADGVVFENNVFTQNALNGLSVIGANAKVVHNTMTDNGQLGFHAYKSTGLIVDGNLVRGNNYERFTPGQSAGGMKIGTSRDVLVTGNTVDSNHAKGIWIDVSAWNVTLVHNLVRRNTSSGLMFEISANAVIADNVVTDNGDNGIYILESSDAQVWNNTAMRNRRDIQVLEGNRTSTADPAITHDVDRVTVRNNVLSDGTSSSPSLFGVDDVRKQESGANMGVTTNYNAYHRTSSSSPQWIANWSNWPSNMVASTTMGDFRSRTGQELNTLVADGTTTNPFVANEATGDYGLPTTSVARGKGQPLPSRIAAAIGVAPGTAVDMGVLTFGAQAPAPAPSLGPAPAPTGLTAAAISSSRINLEWQASSGAS
ncbi:MAG: right-handed parallel beta-helix repeat-containing protein, partial [Actinomycetota bacterium]|nr:right-handed parallel beta-helix repeat-containing protein [Actinomycetota bacterium]